MRAGRILRLFLLGSLWTLLGGPPGGLLPAAVAKEDPRLAALPATYRGWLDEVAYLLTEQEREAFLAIQKDYQRDAFIDRFWRVRDPYPDTARNEYRERYERLVEEARLLFGTLTEDRSRYLLLNGPPAARLEIDCPDLWPLEVWFYPGTERVGEKFYLIFYRRWGGGPFRLWRPAEGVRQLVQFASGLTNDGAAIATIQDSCRMDDADALLAALRYALLYGGMGYESLVAKLETPPAPPSAEWVATFASYTTELPADAATFDAELSVDFPGRHQSRTVVQAALAVRRADLGLARLAGYEGYNLRLTGEVLLAGKLFESFRYTFDFPAAALGGDVVPLVFERTLRPGDYTLVLRVEDTPGQRFCRLERPLSVPALAGPPPPLDPEIARVLAEANAAITSGDDTIEIVEPPGDLLTGMLRFNTLTVGSRIAEVAFSLDGKEILRKRQPPFSVELDLGALPRNRLLTAVAYAADGREVARDDVSLNAGAHRFAVRLAEPRAGGRYADSLRASAEVAVPEGEGVDRVEFYLDETLVATLYQEPYVQPIRLPPGAPVAYVRAVAYLPDGNSTEDVVFINAPDSMDAIDVQFVELYIAVADRQGHPVEGLDETAFKVFEDGVEQRPVRFEQVTNLPIHAGIMLDVSASMGDRLATARAAAVAFFERAIEPRDRATLITFNDHPHLAVKFTSDLPALAGGLAGLRAERGTALWDSLVYALYYFNGVKGQRAILLLSDGRDEGSRFGWEQALEYARRAGVAIYAIGLAEGGGERDARRKLAQLAEETGGRAFFIKTIDELGTVYEQIERELRSRYYLAYQSSNASGSEAFRSIEVAVGGGAGLAAKTLRGYYP